MSLSPISASATTDARIWIRCGMLIVMALTLGLGLPGTAAAEEPAVAPEVPVAKPPQNPKRHEAFLAIAKAGGVDLLFVGDSITDQWRSHGKKVWAREYAPLKAANFGIGGDTVQGVLWRMRNGELDGIHPRLVVLMIGTNNNDDKPDVIAAGIKQIIAEIQQRSAGTRVLLLGILAKGPADGKARSRSAAVNKILATYAQADDPKRVVYLDFSEQFLNEDKTIKKDLMPDTLHPSEAGYALWADAIRGIIAQEMAGK